MGNIIGIDYAAQNGIEYKENSYKFVLKDAK